MGDTENGSWGSRELGGFIRREEARKEREIPVLNFTAQPVRDRLHVGKIRPKCHTESGMSATFCAPTSRLKLFCLECGAEVISLPLNIPSGHE